MWPSSEAQARESGQAQDPIPGFSEAWGRDSLPDVLRSAPGILRPVHAYSKHSNLDLQNGFSKPQGKVKDKQQQV